MKRWLISFLTRALFLTRSDALITFVRPVLVQRLRERIKRRRAKYLAEKKADDDDWKDSYASTFQDASGWPGAWAEVTGRGHPRIIWPSQPPTQWDVQAYTAESSKAIRESEIGVKPAPSEVPFARVASVEAALAAARMHGLEVRAHCCRRGCEKCDGKGYLVGAVARRRQGVDYNAKDGE